MTKELEFLKKQLETWMFTAFPPPLSDKVTFFESYKYPQLLQIVFQYQGAEDNILRRSAQITLVANGKLEVIFHNDFSEEPLPKGEGFYAYSETHYRLFINHLYKFFIIGTLPLAN